MRGLSFLARLSFICNVFFVICMLIKAFYRTEATESVGMIGGTVIVLGYFVSPILNLAMVFLLSGRLLAKKPIPLKNWLVISFFLFLLIHFTVFLILPA